MYQEMGLREKEPHGNFARFHRTHAGWREASPSHMHDHIPFSSVRPYMFNQRQVRDDDLTFKLVNQACSSKHAQVSATDGRDSVIVAGE